MSQELLEAALLRLLTAHYQRGLEPSEVAAVKRLQKLLGREVIRFVPSLVDVHTKNAPDPVAAFRKRIHAKLANA